MNMKSQPMDVETKRALEMSIKHWRKNVRLAKEGKEFGYHTNECALCKMFYNENTEMCVGCPVAARTGRRLCEGSPWSEVSSKVNSIWCEQKDIVWAVEKMLEFLISLREKRKGTGSKTA